MTAADWWQPTIGLLLLAAGGVLGRVVSAGPLARRISVAAAWTLVALIGVHWAQNRLLVATVQAARTGHHLNADGLWLQGTAFLGDALLPIAGAIAVVGATTALARLLARLWIRLSAAWVQRQRLWALNPEVSLGKSEVDPGKSEVIADKPGGDQAAWQLKMTLPDEPKRTEKEEKEDKPRLGICLSGGGIRSASFTLGALQALQGKDPSASATERNAQPTSELMSAEYITAVSGGSYTAGAFLLAVQKPECAENGTVPLELDYDHVFAQGSPEFDHLRRHSSYIADGLREWADAIFVVLRGAFVSTLILVSVAMTAGLWVGHLYYQIQRNHDLIDPWHPIWGPVFVTVGVAGLALVLWLASTIVAFPWKLREALVEIAEMTWLAAAVLAILGAVIPIIAWASMRVTGLSATGSFTVTVGAAKGGALGIIGLITTVFGLLARQRTRMLNAVRTTAMKWQEKLGDIGSRALEWLCVYTGLAMVAAVYLIIFGYSTQFAARTGPDTHPTIKWGVPSWTLPLSLFWLTVTITVMLIVLYLLIDETAIGLHYFYRRRLASAFAVRRIAKSDVHDQTNPSTKHEQPNKPTSTSSTVQYEARPYDWKEDTQLDKYGEPPAQHNKSFPQVIFCASAHCSDPDKTPPGRHVLPFTFSHDYVGGPEIKWCKTPKLCKGYSGRVKKHSGRLKADLTVEAAMAVSGAAFASATGSYQSAANVILALVNARLGTWLPNPYLLTEIDELAKTDKHEPRWWRPWPPRIRRLSYLLREIFGCYPAELPLVFVADGGQYENLGLIELLRRRCTEIYCFDATSDAETFAASLGQSMTLAANELGVRIKLNQPERADPRVTSEHADGGDLKGRLAETPIITTAEVTYPPSGQEDQGKEGFIVIGRCVMDADTPWEIRRHAAAHPLFPHDATGDQWFDDRKFNAYTGLGRYVGTHAREEMLKHRSGPSGIQPLPQLTHKENGASDSWTLSLHLRNQIARR
jgi:hypothetical protein